MKFMTFGGRALLASEGDSRTSLDLIAQIEGHPAAGKVVREQAARLRATIDPSPSAGEHGEAGQPFVETVDAILKGERAG